MRTSVACLLACGVLASCSDRGSPVADDGPQGPPRVTATHPAHGATGPFPDLFTFGDGEDAPHFVVTFSRPVRISAVAPEWVRVAGFPGDVIVRAVALPGKEGEEQDVSDAVGFQLLVPNLFFPQWYEIGRGYEVLVDTSFRTADGTPLDMPYRFSFLPEPRLRVSRFAPSGSGGQAPYPVEPAVQFNGVVRAGAEERIILTPAVSGAWVNVSFGSMPSRFVFTGGHALHSGTQYTIRVDAGVRDTLGYLLSPGESASFATAAFAIGGVVPAPGARNIPVETTISVPCGWPAELASLDTFVTVTPPVPGRWIRESNPERFVLLPDADLDEATTYVVRIGAGVRAIDGTALPAPFEWSFTTTAGLFASGRIRF